MKLRVKPNQIKTLNGFLETLCSERVRLPSLQRWTFKGDWI